MFMGAQTRVWFSAGCSEDKAKRGVHSYCTYGAQIATTMAVHVMKTNENPRMPFISQKQKIQKFNQNPLLK